MAVVTARLTLRMLIASAFVVFALVFFAGRAHADDATPTAPPAAQASPAPTDTSSSPPPSDSSSTPPPSNSTSTPAPADSSSTPAPAPNQPQSSSPAPSDTQSTTPPSGASAQPTPSTPAGADGPKNNNDQNAIVGTNGTSVANSGGNATAANGNPTTPAVSGSGTTSGTINSGSSGATGTNSGSAIDQTAQATATDQGKIDILQIGLIVNIGVANSNSGNNTVGADGSGSGGTGSTTTTTKTGSANSTGDKSQTGVTQSAVLQPGDNSKQRAMVVNVGIAIGNTGLNITIGTMNGAPAGNGQTLTSGNTTGQITSGNSNAIGDQSKSKITQKAGGMASGTATLTIDQRAIIVNFGTAFANTGGNFAFARFDPTGLTAEERQIVEAVLSVLAPFFAPQSGTPGSGTTTAKIGTGNATAIGNASTTDINQMAIGNLTGDQQASSHQTAVVGNLGLALANTGFNGSLANVPYGGLPSSNPELLAAQNALAQFLGLLTNLDWLNSADPFAQFQQSVNLGGVTLELGGSLQGADFMYGWDSGFAPDGGPLPGGVRVRQISGVINIGITTSDSGNNTVVAIVSANHDTSGKSLTSGNGIKNGAPDVLAQVLSGNVNAVGNHSIVSVCQAFHDSVTCAPKVTPGGGGGGGGGTEGSHETPPPEIAPASSPVVLSASVHDPTLPFTGGAPQNLVEVAGALLGVGALLSSRKRRERVER